MGNERPRAVGDEALAAVATVLSGLRRLEDVVGSRAVVPLVDQQIALVDRFVREAGSVRVRNRAARLAAECHQFRGWLAVDGRDWATADRQLADAMALAAEGGAAGVLVEALGFRAYAALKRRRLVEAAALRYATLPLARTAVERAVADLHLARTLAVAGDVRAADRALAQADRSISAADGEPRADLHYYVTAPWLLVQHGLVHVHAGRPRQGAADIAAGLTGIPEQQRHSSWGQEYSRILAQLG